MIDRTGILGFMRVLPIAFSLLALTALTGCHSAYIEAVVQNRTDHAFSPVEVDYPSASFGAQTLAPGQDFHYRFKILGSGDTKLIYTDAAHQEKSFPGPALHEGDEGTLSVTVSNTGVQWESHLKPR